MTDQEIQKFIAEAAEAGAERALVKVGLHDEHAGNDVRVVNRCARDWRDKTFDWIVTCGPRTLAEQKVLVRKGASQTMRSRHLGCFIWQRCTGICRRTCKRQRRSPRSSG